MALPSTAPTVVCTLSRPLLAEGTLGIIKSASLKIDRDIIWVDTGETLYKDSVVTPVIQGDQNPDAGTLMFEVIPVDVPGIRDAAGNEVTNWAYTLRVTIEHPSAVERVVDYVFQPLLVDGNVDLDLVPHTNVVSIPPATTTSIIDGGSL